MELNVVDIFKIANRLGLCYMVEEFDGWESIKSFTATGKAHGEFIICDWDMLKPVILTIPRYIGFIAIPASELPDGTSDRKEIKQMNQYGIAPLTTCTMQQAEKMSKFNFIDLFAGIGGFHQAMHSVGGECVFASERDKNARISYEYNYKEISPNLFENNCQYFNRDINDADPAKIPDFDVCCAGFPCQPFSIAGKRKGFEDTRGTLFFNIANIVNEKIKAGNPPKVLLLENVKGLKSHDHGKTLDVILTTLTELGYEYKMDVLNAKYFGLPQNRERLFIVGWYKKLIPLKTFYFPYGITSVGETIFNKDQVKNNACTTEVADIFEPENLIDEKYTISDRMWMGHQKRKEQNKKNGKGFGYSLFKKDSIYCSTISARYWKDGSEILIDQSEKGLNPRMLTPVEAGRLQGYKIIGNGWQKENCAYNRNNNSGNQEFSIVVSQKEAYHQFGNSVAVPVVKQLAKEIKRQLLESI